MYHSISQGNYSPSVIAMISIVYQVQFTIHGETVFSGYLLVMVEIHDYIHILPVMEIKSEPALFMKLTLDRLTNCCVLHVERPMISVHIKCFMWRGGEGRGYVL